MIKKSTIIIIFSMLLSACGNQNVAADLTTETVDILPSSTVQPTRIPATFEAGPSPSDMPETGDEEIAESVVTLSPEDHPPSGADREFITDFSIHSIPYNEILSGGPGKDGIPSIDDPKFVSVEEADQWLEEREFVIFIQVGDDIRAYPLQILTWHEIINDNVGNLPLLITFCPLCNTAIAFERTVNGEMLDFGTTGRLRYSNLIMYDRQTESWWQQALGEAIAGEYTGTWLSLYPAAIISWSDFKEFHPTGLVLSRDTGYSRPYGSNPYSGYDDISNYPFLYDGPATPGDLRPVERVLLVELNGESINYPYLLLEELHVIEDEVGEVEIVVFWESGTASALDSPQVATGRDVGSVNVFERNVNGGTLSFIFDGENILDLKTGSKWNILGTAIDGELEGTQLTLVISINHFWFSAAAFSPGANVFEKE